MMIEHLLAEVEPLNHAGRMRYMVELGRRSLEDPALIPLLNALEAGGVYERALAVQACHGSRDSARVLRAIGDPSAVVQARAGVIAPLICTDEQLIAALEAMPERQRHDFLSLLRKRRRHSAIDSYVLLLGQRQDRYLGIAIPFASEEIASRFHSAVAEENSLYEWRRMDPARAVAALTRLAKATKRYDYRLLYIINGMLKKLADTCPDDTLKLLRELTRLYPLHSLEI